MRYIPRLVAVIVIALLVVLAVTGMVSLLSPDSLYNVGSVAATPTAPLAMAADGTALAAPYVVPPLLPLSTDPRVAAQLPMLDIQSFANLFAAATTATANTTRPTATPGQPTSVLIRATAGPIAEAGPLAPLFGGGFAEPTAPVASGPTAASGGAYVPDRHDPDSRNPVPTATSAAVATPASSPGLPRPTPTTGTAPTSIVKPTSAIAPTRTNVSLPTSTTRPVATPTRAATTVPVPTSLPSDTPLPPTNTARPTHTPVPPTSTPVPPTRTPRPTRTPHPPTAVPPTSVPPTSVPPTSVPPTDVPPTDVPPTDVPPTDVPPTDVPPTDVPPTDVPPTDVPPTDVPPTPGSF